MDSVKDVNFNYLDALATVNSVKAVDYNYAATMMCWLHSGLASTDVLVRDHCRHDVLVAF